MSMFVLLWTELEALTLQIGRLQFERAAAKRRHDAGLAKTLGAELHHTVRARDALVQRIGAHAGDEAFAATAAPSGRSGQKQNPAAGSEYLNGTIRSLEEVLKARETRKQPLPPAKGALWTTRFPSDPYADL